MQPVRIVKNILVTGGAGFIGSNFIQTLFHLSDFEGKIVNLDLLTYAGSLENLKGLKGHPRYRFIQGDILNQPLVEKILEEAEIDTIVHFAAESHVDRSIAGAAPFIDTNVKGTLSLLEAVRKNPHVHFHHISTDEVYGTLGESGSFSERSSYRPNSPYAASKAASDHLVRAFAETYKISTTLSHCCNNFGPRQFPEKFIPLMICNALESRPLPVYGEGREKRQWLYVDDHTKAIWKILQWGKRSEVYDIGGNAEFSNIELLYRLLELFSFMTKREFSDLEKLIRFVPNRPGHDFRYAIDSSKIQKELGWSAETPFKEGLQKTILWYMRKKGKTPLLSSYDAKKI